jgi:uncharacterized protein
MSHVASRRGLKSGLLLVAVMALSVTSAGAKPVTDCPLRDAAFSADSPLIDLLLSPAAKAVLEKAAPGKINSAPGQFSGTVTPTFTSILTLRKGAFLTGIKPDAVDAIDSELRTLPVTTADRVARCARYDNDVPAISLPKNKPAILLFEKIVGFKDTPSVNAAHAAFLAMAERKGWTIVSTEKAGVFTAKTLRKFDAIIWNNISGDVLSLSQRKAFVRYLESGGSYVAIHGSAGDPDYFWDWYADKLIGARFIGHPMAPQFQDAKIQVNKAHALAKNLPTDWSMSDEWYSFRTNPRTIGANVLLTLDESTYKPVGIMGQDLRMGDHPLAWTNCIGKGRMFYSAIGHRPETYSQPQHVTMLENALDWAINSKQPCKASD